MRCTKQVPRFCKAGTVILQSKSYLLAHGALVGVPGGLIMVWVGDEAGDDPQHREGLDLQVGGLRACLGLVQRNQAVVLLIHVQPLNQARAEEMGEFPLLGFHLQDPITSCCICRQQCCQGV